MYFSVSEGGRVYSCFFSLGRRVGGFVLGVYIRRVWDVLVIFVFIFRRAAENFGTGVCSFIVWVVLFFDIL